MSLRQEMDDHNIPRGKRPQIFLWGLKGGWATASILLLILLNCIFSRVKDKDRERERSEKREEELRGMVNEYLKENLKERTAPIIQDVREYKKSVDTLSIKADTLKKTI